MYVCSNLDNALIVLILSGACIAWLYVYVVHNGVYESHNMFFSKESRVISQRVYSVNFN